MANTITDREMREQVTEALTPYADDYDVNGIVDDIQALHGTININSWPGDIEGFWKIVRNRLNTKA